MKLEPPLLTVKDWVVPTTPTGSVPIGEGCRAREVVACLSKAQPQGNGKPCYTLGREIWARWSSCETLGEVRLRRSFGA